MYLPTEILKIIIFECGLKLFIIDLLNVEINFEQIGQSRPPRLTKISEQFVKMYLLFDYMHLVLLNIDVGLNGEN